MILIHAILAGFSVEMILIAQTVIFMIFLMISADIMNIIVAIIVGLKRALEYIKMHHFKGEHAKVFLGRATAPSPDPTSVGASIRVPSHLTHPDHISGYGPGLNAYTCQNQ